MEESNLHPLTELHLPAPSAGIRPSISSAATFFPTVSAFVTYWNGRLQERRNNDIQVFCEGVIDRINRMEFSVKGIVDANHFWSEDFVRMFDAASDLVARSPDQNKRQYLLYFVANYAREKRPDITLKDVFWELIGGLSGVHLVLLDNLYKRQKGVGVTGLSVLLSDPTRSELLSFREGCKDVLNCEESLFDCIVNKIVSAGLISTVDGPYAHIDPTRRIALTPVGYRFFQFVLGDWE